MTTDIETIKWYYLRIRQNRCIHPPGKRDFGAEFDEAIKSLLQSERVRAWDEGFQEGGKSPMFQKNNPYK